MKHIFVIPECLYRESSFFNLKFKAWIPAYAGMTLLLLSFPVWAKDSGSSAGLTLLKNNGARASALGDAFVSMSDDITAMEFNPASLPTLKTANGSLQYEQGFFDDSFSKVMMGVPLRSGSAVGFSLGHYDSGTTNLYDGTNTQQSVTAEQDRVASIGYGAAVNALSWGLNLRYLWSELAERYSDSAGSFDAGLQYQFARPFRVGFSGPLVQSKLKYAQDSGDLPRVYRAGVSWNSHLKLATGNLPLQLLFDVPYDANESAASVAVGAETHISVLALRLGFNTFSDVQQFTIGAGFQFMRMNLDYAFGMVDSGNVDAVHKVTFSFRFGEDPRKPREISKAPGAPGTTEERIVFEINDGSDKTLDRTKLQLYQVKEGENIESIALNRYGSAGRWKEIFELNRDMYSSPEQIKPGSRILLPVKKGS